jgi:foldase protein PrsA
MTRHVAQIATLGATLSVAVGLSACGGGIPGDAVVQVDGKAVTKTTFNHWMGVAAGSSAAAATAPGQTAPKPVIPVPPAYTACIAHLEATSAKPVKGQPKPTAAQLKSQCEMQYTSYKQEVVGYLVQLNWLLGEGEKLGVKVSDKEVKKQFSTEVTQAKAQQFKEPGSFEKFLASSGYTVSDLLLRTKQTLVQQKIEAKINKEAAKKPTQAEIAKYYNAHKSLYGQPEKRNLLVVLTKTEAQAKKAKQEIEGGKSFASIAKKVSIDPVSKSAGGSLSGITKEDESKPFGEALFNAKTKVLTGPLKTSIGYYVFEVTKTIPGNQQKLSQVSSTISQTITSTKQQTVLSNFAKEFKARWKARTECRKEFSVEGCKDYKPPKTPALPTTVQPSSTATAKAAAPTVKTTVKKK